MRGGSISSNYQLKNEINQRLEPYYILLGQEVYFKEEIISLLKKKILTTDFSVEFNFRRFYSEDTDISEILDTCNTPPSFSEKRLVIVENIEVWDKDDLKAVFSYLKRPAEFTCLVLESLETKLSKGLEPAHFFYPLYENDLKRWIADRVREGEKSIAPDAVALLVHLCNNSLVEVKDEISKLMLYVRDRKTISLKDVEDITADTKQYDVFDLIDAINEKDLGRSLKVFSRLYDSYEESRRPRRKSRQMDRAETEEPEEGPKKTSSAVKSKDSRLYGFFSYLQNNIQRLYYVKYEHEKNKKGLDALQKQLNMKNYPFQKMVRQMKNCRFDRFHKVIHILFDFDRRFKGMAGSVLKKEKIFQDLIYELCTVNSLTMIM